MMSIISRNVEDGTHNFYFDDERNTWVGITPSTQTWEFQQDDDEESYLSGSYITDLNTVVDYDGVYGLPAEVIMALSDMGFDIEL